MIKINKLYKDAYIRLKKEVPRLFVDAEKSTEFDFLMTVVLDDNAILKTSNGRGCVTFDLGGYLVDIDKSDFVEIIIT